MQNEGSQPFIYVSKSAEETRRIGMQLGKMLQDGDIICLQGDLGAGKTTFVQGIAQGWGALDPVSSPTFILVNTYRRADGNLIFHLDTYRLESIPEAEELDLDSMLNEGILLIEWPERLGALIPHERLWIEFDHLQDNQRQMKINATGKRNEQLSDELIRFIKRNRLMLLAIDTSTSQIGLALYDIGQVLGEMSWRGPQKHTVELSPALSGLLSRCGVSMEMVSALGVAIGPGSFTSLRVGLSFVKGIALARNVPVIGINTLDILASAQPASKYPLAVVIQAGRNKLAVGWYKNVNGFWVSQGLAEVASAESLAASVQAETLICGELSTEERQSLAHKNIILASPANCIRRPAVLAELAWERFEQNQFDDAASLAPIYLHTV